MNGYFEGELAQAVRELIRWVLDAFQVLVLGAILVIVAVGVAKVLEVAVRAGFRRVGLDGWGERFGVAGLISRVGLRLSLSQLVARFVFCVALLFAAQVVADALGLSAISALFGRGLTYVPRLVAATLILVLGVAAAGFVRDAVVGAARDTGIEYASALGRLAFILIVFILGMMAVSQLLITTEAVWLVVGWVLAGLALGLGLAFGLGARQITHDILAGFYARQIFELGKEVEVRGQRGVLRSITSTQAVVEQADHRLVVANSLLLTDVVKQVK